jgi:glycosyltransferase involved in cell wall biosynthesis
MKTRASVINLQETNLNFLPRGPMSISVVIPAYNASMFIADTIRSVLAQTLPADEVLVIDDGSTDNTGAIAAGFGPPVRVIRTPNSGLPATRNFGVREAKSEWIAFVDADDIWEPNKLERQMQELSRTPEADLCYTGRIVLIHQGDSTRLGDVVPVPPAAKIEQELLKQCKFPPSCVVIRRSVFLAVGGHDTSFNYVEDWELWLRLLNAGVRFIDCPEPLLQYRVSPGNKTSNAIPMLEGADRVYRMHIMPRYRGPARWLRYFAFRAQQESIAAQTLRAKGDPRQLPMMAASILHRPFYSPIRYKIMAHMLYTRLRGRSK